MLQQLVKRFIIHGKHGLSLGSATIGGGNMQGPLFFLPRGKSVAEGGPGGGETIVGLGARNLYLMSIYLALFHPNIGKQQAIAIFGFISKAARHHLAIFQIQYIAFEHFLAREDGVEHMLNTI